MPLQKTKHVYTQYRKHQHDYKKKTKNRSSDIRKADRVGIDGELKIPD